MNYRERLRDWITDHDLKQKALAKELGISKSVISNYITGRSHMPIETLVRLSQLFGVSVDYLSGAVDDASPSVRLNQAEQQLVDSFRTLDRRQRELILRTIAIMQEQNQRERT